MNVCLFGRPHIKAAHKYSKKLPLKAFLAIAMLLRKWGGQTTRASLASWLWEGRTTDLANTNLRQLLASIRRFDAYCNTKTVQADQYDVWVNPEIVTDLNHFLSTTAAHTRKQLELYVSRYERDFLLGLEDVVGEETRLWLLRTREEFSARFVQVARDGALATGGQFGVKVLKRLLRHHPYNETIFRALLLVRSRCGDSFQAAKDFDVFSARLRRDLGTPPSDKTIGLVARLIPETIWKLEKDYKILSTTPVASNFPHHESQLRAQKENAPIKHLPRLIILPPSKLEGVSEPLAQQYVDFLVEDLTICLCRMRNCTVIAPHTAKQFVQTNQPNLSLSVDYVLATSVKTRGCARVLTVTLTATSTGEVLLAEVIPIEISEVFESCVHLLQSLTNRIGLEIDQSILSSFRHSGDLSAYTYYLIGKKRMSAGTLPNVRAARKAFRVALQLAPDFFAARQMLAHTYYLEWFLLGRADPNYLLQSQKISRELTRVDPLGPGGHWELSISHLYLGDIEEAMKSTSTAARYAPNHADIIAHMADVLCHRGQHTNALEQIEFAMQLNPLPPDEYFWIRSGILFLLEKYKDALRATLKAKAVKPFNYRMIAACHAMLGNTRLAARARHLHDEEYPDFKISEWIRTVPMTNSHDAKNYISALKMAGFS